VALAVATTLVEPNWLVRISYYVLFVSRKAARALPA